jgi:hypothetical protein
MRHQPGSSDTQPHLIGRQKAEAFVQPPTIIRGVQDDAPDAAPSEFIEDRAHQSLGDAAPSPVGLHVDVEDDRFGPEFHVVVVNAGPREDRSQLHTGPPNDGWTRPLVFGDPRQILATRQGLAQVRGGCPLQCLLVVSEQSPHIPKHRRAMVCEERDVGRVSRAHGEGWLWARHGWMSRC